LSIIFKETTVAQKSVLTDNNVKAQINSLFATWAKSINSENNNCNMLFEHKALNKLLSSAHQFKSLYSLGLYDKGILIAFNIFEIIDKDYTLHPFIMANRDFDGSFQFLMKKAIELLHEKGIKYLNFEADYGIDSWRNYKMSYRPPFFLKKYTIERNN
jgi:hypothetical protein